MLTSLVARDGANVVIAAKSVKENPVIPGTIFSAAKEVEKAGGKALRMIRSRNCMRARLIDLIFFSVCFAAIECDVRSEEAIEKAVH